MIKYLLAKLYFKLIIKKMDQKIVIN